MTPQAKSPQAKTPQAKTPEAKTPEAVTRASGERLKAARRLTVKIGSALLVEPETGTLKAEWLQSLVHDLAEVRARGTDVLIVTSGAIALGRRILKLAPGPLRLEESQAAAAIGQIALAHAWRHSLASHSAVAGQVLLTLADTEERRRYLNARATLFTLLRHKAVPVINENDTVATSEIRYGDNDRLAARVTSMVSGDCLVLLSDVDGLYTAAPDQAGATLIPEVRDLTPEIEAMAGKATSGSMGSGSMGSGGMGSGGMATKIEAARIAMGAGAHMVIASGRKLHPLQAILDGGPVTWFVSQANPIAARKRWIAGSLVPTGKIVIDAGAEMALAAGKSLLPAGVKRVEGQFARGDAISIISERGHEIARGLVAYDRADAERIIGRRSADIEAVLGFRGRDEMVHRDDLVMGKVKHEPGK